MADDLKIGIIGFNKGGRYFHAPLIDAAEGCKVSAIVARSSDRQAAAKADYPDLPIFHSITDMAKAEAVEAVTISTPLDTHLDLAQEALSFSLPTIIDKPFAHHAKDAKALIKEAEEKKLLLTVYQNRRWDADYLTVKRLFTAGDLGDVWLFESRMEQFSPPGGLPASGGGVLLDFGSHVFDQTLQLLGPAQNIYAEIHPIAGREPLEDRFFASVLHTNGIRSHLTGDFNLQGSPAPRFRVTGSKGSFAIPSHDGMTEAVMAGERKSTLGERWAKVPEAFWGKLESPGVSNVIPSEEGAWPRFYEGFAKAVRGQGALPVDPWESLEALELIEAAKESAATQKVVNVSS